MNTETYTDIYNVAPSQSKVIFVMRQDEKKACLEMRNSGAASKMHHAENMFPLDRHECQSSVEFPMCFSLKGPKTGNILVASGCGQNKIWRCLTR